MALTDNLVAYWRLDEASGTRADQVGGLTLTDNNTVGSASGVLGTAASFVNSNAEYLSHATAATLEMGDNDFTITGWVYFTSQSPNRFMLSKDGGAGNREYGFLIDGDGRFRFFGCENDNDTVVSCYATSFGTFSNDTWYFVAGRYNASTNTLSISINAGAVDTAAMATSMAPGTSAEFRIGGWAYGLSGYEMDGRVQHVGIWKRRLSDAEVTELHNDGDGLDPTAGSGFSATCASAAGGAAAAATATFTPPTFAASAESSAGGAACAATATSTPPTAAATAASTAGGAACAATATFTPPAFSGAATSAAGGAACAAIATFTPPEYSAACDSSAGGASCAATATFTPAGSTTRTATCASEVGGAACAAAATFTPAPGLEARLGRGGSRRILAGGGTRLVRAGGYRLARGH